MALASRLLFFCCALSALPACNRHEAGAVASNGSATDNSFAETLAKAQAATADQKWSEAVPLWQGVVAANPVNPAFAAQFATALYSSKEYRRAIPAYQKAMELRAGYPATQAYNVACSYALLGEREDALQWLEKSFAMGFRDLEGARADSDLLSLHGDARFQDLVGLPDLSKMSRDQGWRADLALLTREVLRKGFAEGVYRAVTKSELVEQSKRLDALIPQLSDEQIFLELMKLLKRVGDGHTGVLRPPPIEAYALSLPVQFYLFKEGLYIIATDVAHKSLLGAHVVRFGEHTVDEVIRAIDPVVSRDNEIWPSQVIPYRMRNLGLLKAVGIAADVHKIDLAVEEEGRAQAISVEADTAFPDIWNEFPKSWLTYSQSLGTPPPLYLKSAAKAHWYEYLPESKILYVQYNRVLDDPDETLAAFVEKLFAFADKNEVSKLVIDMRWNNGGNTYLNQPLVYALIQHEKMNQKGKLFVIIGRRTFSAAQNAASLFERYTNAIFVGEPTGSSPNFVGEETPFTLPYSKILMNVSDLYWKSAWPLDYRTFIAPQLYTPPTFAAYKANRDPAMEAIVAYR